MRYLGRMAALAVQCNMPHIAQLCTQEMIVRAAKHLINGFLRDVKPDLQESKSSWFLAPCVCRFLNTFLGPKCCGTGLSKEELEAANKVLEAQEKEDDSKDQRRQIPRGKSRSKRRRARKVDSINVRLPDGKKAPTDPLAPANLWMAIHNLVQTKYNCKLGLHMEFSPRRKLCMLRSLCKKVGVQLACRNYDFTKDTIFEIEDVLNLYPVVKTIELTSKDAADYIEQGRIFLGRGRLHAAYAKLIEAQGILHQTYGPMHEQSAQCYTLLALVCYRAQDIPQAVEMQQKALLVYERILGIDHPDTVHAHSTMALFLHSSGQPKHALTHIRRALYLYELMCGPNHPNVAASHINIAMIYQDSGQVQRGLNHLKRAKECFQAVLGKNHMQVALCDHTIAVAHSLMGNFREAINFEKSAKALYAKEVGDKHPRIQESLMWLNWFTKNAVEVEKGLTEKGGLQPVHPNLSPFVWVSLQRFASPRQISPTDLVHLIKLTRSNQQKKSEQKASLNEAEKKDAVDLAPQPQPKPMANGGGELTKAQKRKIKRKLQRQRQKAEREAAAAAKARSS
mmetsp:Transcript_5797/g.11493  ORF Transcript_5797/g.11493 Transcript_5797/m.11493 type:complete len:566 (-) Transcript_5797:205-1902(-)